MRMQSRHEAGKGARRSACAFRADKKAMARSMSFHSDLQHRAECDNLVTDPKARMCHPLSVPDRAVVHVGIDRHGTAVIEGVERLETELQAQPPAKSYILDQRRVPDAEIRVPINAPDAGVAEVPDASVKAAVLKNSPAVFGPLTLLPL